MRQFTAAISGRSPGELQGVLRELMAAADTRTVLRRIGGFSSGGHAFGPEKPTPDGITFARAALRTWPS